MTRIGKWIAPLAVLLAFFVAQPAAAQTTLNSTTLSAAVTSATAQTFPLTSITSVTAGDIMLVDREFVQVQSVGATSVVVTRGREGSSALPHASGVVVWNGPRVRFYMNDPVGVCTATNEAYLPHIVIPTASIYQCQTSEWVRWRDRGWRDFEPGRSDGGATYTALGAITIQPGISFINGTTLAMTLANPTTEQNGMVMYIIATNASAHTVTYTAGFGGGTTSRDVATFGGAVNDELVIVAFNGVWWVVSTRNVTIA